MELEISADRHFVESAKDYVRGLYPNTSSKYTLCNKTEDYNVVIGILIGAFTIPSGNPYAAALGAILSVAAFYQAYKVRCPLL